LSRAITAHDFEDVMAAGRKEANFSQGWGIATLITAMAVGAFVLAGVINKRTYVPPTDPMAPSTARDAHAAPAGEHAAPAGEQGAAKH
jgi:hypothetical protein